MVGQKDFRDSLDEVVKEPKGILEFCPVRVKGLGRRKSRNEDRNVNLYVNSVRVIGVSGSSWV